MTKINEDQIKLLYDLRCKFKLSYQKLADYHESETGVKLSAKQIFTRIRDYKQKNI